MPSARNIPPFTLRLSCTLLCLAGLATLPPPLHAAETPRPASQAAARSFDIAPGPLSEVLARYAASAGVALSFDAASLRNIRSPGLKGSYTVQQGFDRLLAGSGMAAVPRGQGDYALKAAPRIGGDAKESQLAVVTVTAGTERDGTTEGSGSYKATATNTATKLNLSPRETPQTVSVVTSQQMADFGMTSVDDALKAVSGAFVADQGNNGATYFSRGFQMQTQYDGAPNPIGISESNRNPQIDNAFLDRVEVLQGAAGLLTGAGTPGGTINLMRKRPTESFQAQAEAQLASWDGQRIVGDIAGPFIESGRIRGRLVAVADNSKSFVDYVYRNRRAVYGVVEADLTPTTTLETSVQYQQDTGRNHFGPPFAADGSETGISRSAFFGDAGNRTVKDYTLTTLGLTQRLPGDWQAKATFTHGETEVDISRYSYINGNLDAASGDGMVLGRMRSLTRDIRSNAADVYASGPFRLFGRKHEAAFGLNGSSMRVASRGAGYLASIPINVYTFDPSSLSDIPEGTPYFSGDKTTQWGTYGVARFSLTDALKLITGVRVSNYKNENLLTGRTSSEENGVVSPYAGLIYDLNAQYSVYASYSDIFNPQTRKSADGSMLKPVVGANYEAGIKGELLDKRLNVAAAVFRLEQTNLARVDSSVPYDPTNACGGTCYIAADKVVSQGIDLSVSGQWSPGWNVAAGYTFSDSEYASGVNDGQRYNTNLPRHCLRLATAYKLPGTDWTLGGNLTARSKVYYSDTGWTIRSGGLALVGLMAKYEINPKAELTATVSNLFDRSYRAYLSSKTASTWGEPRRVAVNLKYKF